jgi:hypothetical protein
MSGQRISSSGPSGRLGAAMIPIPASAQMSWSSWGPIVGRPSNSNIPAPAPVPGKDRSEVAIAIAGVGAGGMGLPSSDYAFWNPGQYYQPKPPAGPSTASMATNSDNQMPVPAVPPRGKPAVMLRPHGVLGQQQVGWPITTPYYQWRKSLGG